MDQDKNKNLNGQVNNPGIKGVPGNPYTTTYQEYIVDPGAKITGVTRGRKVASMVLCALADMTMLTFCVMLFVFIYQLLIGYRNETVTTENFTVGSLVVFAYFNVISLTLSIVAKALNRKSIWAVFNFILIGIILAAVIAVSQIVPGMVNDKRKERDSAVTEALNSDIEDLMREYSFDVQDYDEDYKYRKDSEYDIWVYISSEASDKKIREVDDFLEDIYSMDSSRENKITFVVHPVYFEPDDDSRFVFLHTYEFQYETLSPRPYWADIDDHIKVWEFDARETSHVPEEVEKGQMLIVIR